MLLNFQFCPEFLKMAPTFIYLVETPNLNSFLGVDLIIFYK